MVASYGVPTGDLASILAQYDPRELELLRQRGMIGRSGIPIVPPGSTKFNSAGEPYAPNPGGATPQERSNANQSWDAIQQAAKQGQTQEQFFGPTPQEAQGPVVAEAPIPPMGADTASRFGSALGPLQMPGLQWLTRLPQLLGGQSNAQPPPAPVAPEQVPPQLPQAVVAPSAPAPVAAPALTPPAGSLIPPSQSSMPKVSDPRGLVPFIQETAIKYGIDPAIAVRVAASEGLANPIGDGGKSGSAFQLYTGGGLGNEFQKETGLDPLDPKNEKAAIDFALKKASQVGWGPWHGAKKIGLGEWEGIKPGAGGTMTASASPETTLASLEASPLKPTDPSNPLSFLISSAQAAEPTPAPQRPNNNLAQTLAAMASGFLGGKGPAASLSGGFGGMAQGLENRQNADFKQQQLDLQQQKLGGNNILQSHQLALANLLAKSGVPIGDALLSAGMQLSPERVAQLNAQAQGKGDGRLAQALIARGVPPGDAQKAAGFPISDAEVMNLNQQANVTTPLPPTSQRIVDKGLETVASIRTTKSTLASIQDSLKDGSLKLDPFHVKWYQAQALVGNPMGDPGVVKYQQLQAALHVMQSDELRKNVGVQTDKDAERAMIALTGGGLTSNDQAIAHTNYLINHSALQEKAVRNRVDTVYRNAKQRPFDWSTVDTSIAGETPTSTPKQIGDNIYGTNETGNKGVPTPPPAPQVGGGTGVGLTLEQRQLIDKYRTR